MYERESLTTKDAGGLKEESSEDPRLLAGPCVEKTNDPLRIANASPAAIACSLSKNNRYQVPSEIAASDALRVCLNAADNWWIRLRN